MSFSVDWEEDENEISDFSDTLSSALFEEEEILRLRREEK